MEEEGRQKVCRRPLHFHPIAAQTDGLLDNSSLWVSILMRRLVFILLTIVFTDGFTQLPTTSRIQTQLRYNDQPNEPESTTKPASAQKVVTELTSQSEYLQFLKECAEDDNLACVKFHADWCKR
jgi:thiol:disulfide interchange protein